MSARVSTAALRKARPVFAALGDDTRLRLLAALCAGGAMSITQLTAGIDLSRQAVTKHLQVLAEAGLVHDVKAGRERLWQFDPAQLEAARLSLDLIARQWDHALQKLQAFVEV
jgi:DNA-binding transcriptional ArsR family regulator